jgi:hypothetical protein
LGAISHSVRRYGDEKRVHVMVAWEISEEEPSRKTEIDSALKEALKGYSWVRPLGNVYVVKVKSDQDRDRLGESLKAVARESSGVHVIFSPAMEGGRYNGWLPKDLWPKIRQRVDVDV